MGTHESVFTLHVVLFINNRLAVVGGEFEISDAIHLFAFRTRHDRTVIFASTKPLNLSCSNLMDGEGSRLIRHRLVVID